MQSLVMHITTLQLLTTSLHQETRVTVIGAFRSYIVPLVNVILLTYNL